MNYTSYPITESVRHFFYKVYGWMAVGLSLTAATAYYIFSNPTLFSYILRTPGLSLLLFIAQIGLVIALSGFITRMNQSTAIGIFLGYSVLTGITLSFIFHLYHITSIYLAFGIAASMFVTMAIYGYLTQDDLTSIGSLARMGLFGIIIALLINFFLQSAQMDYIISFIGVGVFTLLTAYDSQKIKQLGHMMIERDDIAGNVAILGALTLYLDFINLFLFLLRIFGRQRSE